MFGDPKQHEHMMQGVKRAHASAKTPEHLRPHLAKRLEGGSMAFPNNRPGNRVIGSTGRTAIEPRDGTPSYEATQPRKTVVGNTGRGPIKTVATTPRNDQTPLKTVVGNTARPPVKTTVGNLAQPPRKTIVGSTAAAPLKTTPANLGKGSKGPLGMDAADRGPINAANPSTYSASLGKGDGNLGRSVAPMPPPSPGPPNASMDWTQPRNVSGIEDGGMGPAAKSMSVAPPRGVSGGRGWNASRNATPREISAGRGSRRAAPRRPSQFFGE